VETHFFTLSLDAAMAASEKIMEVYRGKRFRVRLKRDFSPVTHADRLAHEVITEILTGSGLPVLSEEGSGIPFDIRKDWGSFWMVDPLDGTKEFIRRNDEFTVNIALIQGNRPVAGVILAPVTGDCWFASPETGAGYRKGPLPQSSSIILGDFQSLPLPEISRPFRIIASRSHMNSETQNFIAEKTRETDSYEITGRGSSLKFCMLAERSADLYPRFGPTMEWDTAAGDAILSMAGGKVIKTVDGSPLQYNKPNLLNPFFVASANS
jgi:3'(2'), 5'-bisphosphate nucleotidase